jgi:hypothetical protein
MSTTVVDAGRARSTARARDIAFTLAVVVLVAARIVVAVRRGAGFGEGGADINRFRAIGRAHGIPYRDFAVEYPIALVGLCKLLVLVAPGRAAFGRVVVWLACACDLAIGAVLARAWGRVAALWYLVVALPLAPLLAVRVDLLATLLVVAALARWHRTRRADAAGGLVAGAACKLWPAALLPWLFGAARRRERRALARWTVAVALPIAAVWFALDGLGGPRQVLTYRGARGWEIESIVGAVLRAVHAGTVQYRQGAYRIGASPQVVTIMLALAGSTLAAWAAWRGGCQQRLGRAWIASIGVLMVTSALLSPQFVIWIVPAAAIAWVEGDRWIAAGVAAVVVLTAPEHLDVHSFVTGREIVVAQVLARNALLIATVVAALVLVARDRARPDLDHRREDLVDDLDGRVGMQEREARQRLALPARRRDERDLRLEELT